MAQAAIISNESELETTSTAARRLDVSEGLVRFLARRGALPSIRLASGARVYRRIDVDALRRERSAVQSK
jgi:DNA-binding transcriptional MerR regulator